MKTKAGRWWEAWGRAAALGAVVVLPTGTAYSVRRRRRRRLEANEAEATKKECEMSAPPDTHNGLVSSVV